MLRPYKESVNQLLSVIIFHCFSGASSTRFGAARNRGAACFPRLLSTLCLYFPALLSHVDRSLGNFLAFSASRANQAVLRGFFAIEDGAAGAADGHAMFDFFRADGALRERLGIVEPRLFQAELASGAALQVGDEHGILGALPFEIGGGDEAALKFLEAASGIGKFRLGWLGTSRDEDAVETYLARVAIDFARDVFCDFPRGDAVVHGALIAHVDHAGASADGSDGVRFAGLRRTHLQRTEVRTVARRPLFR